jgi:alpha-tubulin suppressor-like RCC1 family protein
MTKQQARLGTLLIFAFGTFIVPMRPTNAVASSDKLAIAIPHDNIAAGGIHTCVLTVSQSVKCWGANDYGQLGDGTWASKDKPVTVNGLRGEVSALGAGVYHTCGLSIDGLFCWGHNSSGQLGDGTTADKALPINVIGLRTGVVDIAVGGAHTCALTTNGSVKCWGANDHGQLGDGSSIAKSVPVNVLGLDRGVSAIAAGMAHTCALLSDGGVMCWGENTSGQLGDGTTQNKAVPVKISGIGNNVNNITLGFLHTCLTTTSGVAMCWGSNHFGQIGDETSAFRTTPTMIGRLSQEFVKNIVAGWEHTCALTTGNSVKCWGRNNAGQLGNGTTADQVAPSTVKGLHIEVSAIAAGWEHTCVLSTGGGVKCWGGNGIGQLGDGTGGVKSTPVSVKDLSNASAIAAGWHHTCALIADGGVKCWGADGLGTKERKLVPVNVSGLATSVSAITAELYHTCALTIVGSVMCWGINHSGQLGDGTTVSKAAPTQVIGLDSGISAIAAGSEHTCALTTSGGVKCWGKNESGQLGDGTSISRLTPVNVNGLSSGVKEIEAGRSHTCALTMGGEVKCWGKNDFGQLGDGTTSSKAIPTNVGSLVTGNIAIAAGGEHTCVLTTGGTVKCWGWNNVGQLGDGTVINRLVPISVVGLNTSVLAVVGGGAHTCALTTGGGVKCWGWNLTGGLGDGTTQHRALPVGVIGLSSGVSAIGAGDGHTCAITSSETKCWGASYNGQLGDGTAWRTTPVDVVGFEGTDGKMAISGRIADLAGIGISGLDIFINSVTTITTDSSGNFKLDDVAPGTYTLTPSSAGYIFQPKYRTIVVPGMKSHQDFIVIPQNAIVDVQQSSITLQPDTLVADGNTHANIIITLRNASGQPVAGKNVQVVSERGSLIDLIEQPVASSNADGQITARIRSSTNGQTTLRAWVLGDGVLLNASAFLTFTTPSPAPNALKARAERFATLTNRELDQMWDHTQSIVAEAKYFNLNVTNQEVKLIWNFVSGVTDTFLGYSDKAIGDVLYARSLHELGMPAVKSEFACKFSDALIKDISKLPTNQQLAQYANIGLRYGLITLAARYNNKCLFDYDITASLVIDTLTIGDVAGAHFNRPSSEWPIKEIFDDARGVISYDMGRINSGGIPALSQSQIDEYIKDFGDRELTIMMNHKRLENARRTLNSVHYANTTDSLGGQWFQVLARSSSKWGAAFLFDGAGAAAVSGFYNAFDSYMNSKSLNEYRQMAMLGNSAILKTAPETVTSVENVAHTGLGNILEAREVNNAKGSIANVQHINEGESLLNFFTPTDSYSNVTIKNTGNETARYQIMANYLAQTTRAKFVPWATLWFDVESPSISLVPGQTGVLKVPYLSGSMGYTPQKDTSIEMFLVATNNKRAMVVDYLGGNLWQPTLVASSRTNSAITLPETVAAGEVIDAPLVSIAGALEGDSRPKGLIWVNNPFTSSVLVTVTQPVPAFMNQIDAGVGRIEGGNIVWTTYVAPESSEMMTYTARLNLRPATNVVLPPTQLVLQVPTGEYLSHAVTPRTFTMPGFNVYLSLARR